MTTPYEALVASASRLTDTDALAEIDGGDLSAASGFLERNRFALESARHALGQQCAVPLRYEESFFPEHCVHFSHLRNLARAFQVEALWAASSENYGAAARIGIDLLELANAVRRGGLVTDLLVGIAISGIAMEKLRKIRANLDHATRREMISDLQRIEAECEPFADVVARDREWEVAVGYEDQKCDFTSQEPSDPEECGLSAEEQKELHQLLQQMAELPESDRRKMHVDLDRRMIASMRLLVVDLALRTSYESSNSYPIDLSSLVPAILPRLPLDPFTNESFLYRSVGDSSFHLYSTGPKSFDGGGQFGPWPSVAFGCADLCLDAGDYLPDCCAIPRRLGLANRIASAVRMWWRAWRR